MGEWTGDRALMPLHRLMCLAALLDVIHRLFAHPAAVHVHVDLRR